MQYLRWLTKRQYEWDLTQNRVSDEEVDDFVENVVEMVEWDY